MSYGYVCIIYTHYIYIYIIWLCIYYIHTLYIYICHMVMYMYILYIYILYMCIYIYICICTYVCPTQSLVARSCFRASMKVHGWMLILDSLHPTGPTLGFWGPSGLESLHPASHRILSREQTWASILAVTVGVTRFPWSFQRYIMVHPTFLGKHWPDWFPFKQCFIAGKWENMADMRTPCFSYSSASRSMSPAT